MKKTLLHRPIILGYSVTYTSVGMPEGERIEKRTKEFKVKMTENFPN